MATWLEKGVPGTKEVIKLKTNLKSLRTKNTFAVKNLQREQGPFLGCISEVSEGDQLTSFQYAQLKRVAVSLTSVEKSFDSISEDLYELNTLLNELQNRELLTAAHVEELKADVTEQERKYEARTNENNAAVKEAMKILVKWQYDAPPVPTPSSPASVPAATAQPQQPHRRRFVAVDSF